MTTRTDQGTPLPQWTAFVTRHCAGGTLQGQVTAVHPFGALIHLSEGITGLLPRPTWTTEPTQGATIQVRIATIDVEHRRVSLTPA